jgi:hypothetical protein
MNPPYSAPVAVSRRYHGRELPGRRSAINRVSLYEIRTATAEYLYVPATSEDEEGSYGVFVTNRDHVTPDEITYVTNSYSRRWDIENQYKPVQSYLPKTSSRDYRVRLFNFTFAALLYNPRRLTDFLVKVGMEREIRSPPVVFRFLASHVVFGLVLGVVTGLWIPILQPAL